MDCCLCCLAGYICEICGNINCHESFRSHSNRFHIMKLLLVVHCIETFLTGVDLFHERMEFNENKDIYSAINFCFQLVGVISGLLLVCKESVLKVGASLFFLYSRVGVYVSEYVIGEFTTENSDYQQILKDMGYNESMITDETFFMNYAHRVKIQSQLATFWWCVHIIIIAFCYCFYSTAKTEAAQTNPDQSTDQDGTTYSYQPVPAAEVISRSV
mmetsp:Transcript_38648/g.50927  ORF Transcript_38648/g.50927 Transcript_38648/m.50927 type:complete len:215 (-) Transcript_38648:347-991(-)